ncbi:MAG: hypothetical protein KAW16_06160, partial [candidate division Zixibacteria bacterium]|nr:hypothetical protein [candidate division Zixibacteria bacterium]
FIFLAIIIPLLLPMNLDFSVTPPVRSFYDAIEELPPGSKVLVSCDYDPGSMPELFPMNLAVFHHLLSRGHKVIVMQLWATGMLLAERAMTEVLEDFPDKKHGEDWVNLGFKEGREVVMVSMGTNIPKTFPTDSRGTNVEDIPIMQGVTNFDDIALLMNISGGLPGTKEWVLQVQSRYHVKLVSGCTAVSAPEFYPYIQSGQLVGLLGGMKGAAEYEKLLQRPGTAQRGMDAQSVSHIIVFLFILIGNIAYFSVKGRKKRLKVSR